MNNLEALALMLVRALPRRWDQPTPGDWADVLAKFPLFRGVSKRRLRSLSRDATFNVDRKAGLVQVTDYPDRLERVAAYLDAVEDRVHRQAQIDIRVVEVELSDEKATGIDWAAVAAQMRVSNDRAGNAPASARDIRLSFAGSFLFVCSSAEAV